MLLRWISIEYKLQYFVSLTNTTNTFTNIVMTKLSANKSINWTRQFYVMLNWNCRFLLFVNLSIDRCFMKMIINKIKWPMNLNCFFYVLSKFVEIVVELFTEKTNRNSVQSAIINFELKRRLIIEFEWRRGRAS